MVLVEAKLGADFGHQQLGREWIVLRDQGGARRLRLLVVSPDGWSASDLHALVLRDLSALSDTDRPPNPEEIRSLCWFELLPRLAAPSSSEAAILNDLEHFLDALGLLRVPFSGWERLPTPPELPEVGTRWY